MEIDVLLNSNYTERYNNIIAWNWPGMVLKNACHFATSSGKVARARSDYRSFALKYTLRTRLEWQVTGHTYRVIEFDWWRERHAAGHRLLLPSLTALSSPCILIRVAISLFSEMIYAIVEYFFSPVVQSYA